MGGDFILGDSCLIQKQYFLNLLRYLQSKSDDVRKGYPRTSRGLFVKNTIPMISYPRNFGPAKGLPGGSREASKVSFVLSISIAFKLLFDFALICNWLLLLFSQILFGPDFLGPGCLLALGCFLASSKAAFDVVGLLRCICFRESRPPPMRQSTQVCLDYILCLGLAGAGSPGLGPPSQWQFRTAINSDLSGLDCDQ